MALLILVRHGQSEWNKKNIFTGWIDIPLSKEGIEEAIEAGELIKNSPIDIIFTSTLIRGINTALLIMLSHSSGKVPVILHPGEGKLEEWGRCHSFESEQELIPVVRAWELNERMYGELQGMNKQEMREKYGDEQVKIWRRSYAVAPPNGESLKMTAARTIPYFENTILPHLENGQNVLIAAHGNSLRSIIMDLEHLNDEEVLELEVPTGVPIAYEFRDGTFEKSQLL